MPAQDNEIQSWIKDLRENGYPSGSDGTAKGVPQSFTSVQSLANFLTIVIFTCSCQHAAVNLSQKDVNSYVPNSPSIMRNPPPTQKGEVALNHILDTLPDKHRTSVVVAAVYDLTKTHSTQVILFGR